MLEEALDVLDGCTRPAEQPSRAGEVALLDEPRRLLGLVPGVLEPELRRLVDGLKKQLVAVRPLVGGLLQREQLVRAEVTLVVARPAALEDRRVLVRLGRHGANAT